MGLEVTPDALSFISLSGTGTISDDGTLAYGNPEDFTCCLYKGSLIRG